MIEKRFVVQCGTVFNATDRNKSTRIVVALAEPDGVMDGEVLETNGQEFISHGIGTATVRNIAFLTGDRWSLDRMIRAINLGLTEGLGHFPQAVLKGIRNNYIERLKAEYDKPPLVLDEGI